MARLFDGEVDVAYMQFYVETPEVIPHDMERRFAGQTNGLCGAGEAGMLQCTTGLHTGPVPVAVDLLDTAPDQIDDGPTDRAGSGVENGWEEVVEVSLTTTTPHVLLYDWDHQHPIELALGHGSFRVRFHATNMQAGQAADTRRHGEAVLDRYLLQLWPADPAPDAVLRQTSELAAYWHDTARNTTTSVKSNPSSDPRSDPRSRPRSNPGTSPAVEEDELLAFQRFLAAISATEPERQRAAAVWLAHHATQSAGPETVAWAQPGLDALDQGRPPPAPFNDHQDTLAAAHRDLAHLEGHRDQPTVPGEPSAPTANTSAVLAVVHAADPDPWTAVMMTLNMTDGVSPFSSAELHAEIRARFLS